MEITSTVITRTARHRTDSVLFTIEYTVVDERLDRIHLNMFDPVPQPLSDAAEAEQAATPTQGEYIGSIYFEGRNLSCNIPWREDAAELFSTGVGFIARIREELPAPAEDAQEPATQDNSR